MTCHARFMKNSRLLALVSVFLALICAASDATAANYSIYGRVYSAARLLPGQLVPINPLSNISAGQVVLKDKDLTDTSLYAVATKSMVRVSVEDANGASLAPSFLVKYNGGYSFSFSNAANSLKAKLVVRNVLTNAKMMENTVDLSSAAGGTVFLLVESEYEDVGKPAPGNKLFTMVGKIPNTTVQTGQALVRTINPGTGLANIPAATAAQFSIPPYSNAPFGGTLDIKGAFSNQFYAPDKYCYQVLADGIPLTDPLYKTMYTIVGGNVTAEQVSVGPKDFSHVSKCYSVTPISAALPGKEVFWSNPDMLFRWNTSAIPDAKKTLTLKLYDAQTGVEQPLAANPFSALTLQINNEPVEVKFVSIFNGPKDMINGHACDIVKLADKLNITYQAYHPNPAGYLGSYAFTVTSNEGAVTTIASGSYTTGIPFTGTPAAGAQAVLDNSNISHPCAYVLGVSAVARTTNGYWNFNQRYAWKAYYLQ